MRGVLESLRKAVPQVMRDTENTLISLALAVAQKLVADMPISAAMVEAAVRDALAQVEGTAHFTVRLHPADLELLQKSGSPLLTPGDGARNSAFFPRPTSPAAAAWWRPISARWTRGGKQNLTC